MGKKKPLFTVTLYLLVEQHLLYQSKRKQRQNLHNKQHAIIINSSVTDYKKVSHKEACRWRLSNGKQGIQEDSYTYEEVP